MLSQAAQDYIKSIYKLQNGHEPVASVNTSLIAEKMEVAAASATNMVKKLAEMKLVQHTPYRGVELTQAGREVALEILRHHRLIELYLSKALGYKWDEVDAEADRLEHVISEEFEDKIDEALGFPTTDPHGAPIPTKGGDIARFEYQRLTDIPEGRSAVIGQVSDQDPEMLRYMSSLGLLPGVVVEVKEKAPFNGPIEVQVSGGERQALGVEVAGHIFVEIAGEIM